MITKIHHVGIVVRSLETALSFYRDRLGLPLTRESDVPDQGVRVALLAAGESEVELVEPTVPETGAARFLERRGGGMHHLCFESDEIEKEMTRLKALGVPLIDETARKGLAGMIAFLHPQATAGVLVELATPIEPSPAPRAACRFHHLVIGVGEPPGAARLYTDLFGLRVRDAGGGAVILTTRGATFLEFRRPDDPGSDAIRPGLSLLAFSVDDPTKMDVVHRAVGLGPAASHGVNLTLLDSRDPRCGSW